MDSCQLVHVLFYNISSAPHCGSSVWSSDGHLYLRAGDRLRLVVMNAEERNEVLRRFHDYLAVGVHPGRRRVEEMVRASYHWAKIRPDVQRWVSPVDST